MASASLPLKKALKRKDDRMMRKHLKLANGDRITAGGAQIRQRVQKYVRQNP